MVDFKFPPSLVSQYYRILNINTNFVCICMAVDIPNSCTIYDYVTSKYNLLNSSAI